MAIAIGAAGIMGVAVEATSGTYLAPTKFFPFTDENLLYQQDTVWRRPIRNTPGLIGAVNGNAHTEGDITTEALSDVIPYFMKASRCTVSKSGAGPYVYTYTPSPVAVPSTTLSITIQRGTEVMGYTGCIVAGFTYTIGDNGLLQVKWNIVGSDEATAAALSGVTWPISTPFGAGQYNIQIPTATQVFDVDTFEFAVNDNADPQYRLNNVKRGAQFVKFGESEATISLERDWNTRSDYDAFKALTSQSVTLSATKGASESIVILAPTAIKDTYEINMGGQGDLVRASIKYQCAIDATGKHYQLTVTTPTENVT